jgi:hypothetical protein
VGGQGRFRKALVGALFLLHTTLPTAEFAASVQMKQYGWLMGKRIRARYMQVCHIYDAITENAEPNCIVNRARSPDLSTTSCLS